MNYLKILKANILDIIFYPKGPKGKEFIKFEILMILSSFINELKSNTNFREKIIKDMVEKYRTEKQWRKKLNGESINEQEVIVLIRSLTK